MANEAGAGITVAVIGAGGIGLTAIKNFVEAGFEVTAFESNSYIGGLWHFTEDPTHTSVLRTTKSNVSKQLMSFTDFPFPESTPTHPSAKQVEEYLESYAEHFNLNQYIRLSAAVTSIERDESRGKWIVSVRPTDRPDQAPEKHTFDKLIVATGQSARALTPEIPSIHKFQGEVLHSQAFKDPSKCKDKSVLVVSISNSASDSAAQLINIGAKKVYISHRRNFRTVPRIYKGKAFDHNLTFRLQLIMAWLQWLAPSFGKKMLGKILAKAQNDCFPRLKDHISQQRKLPPAGSYMPIFSEDLADNLLEGRAESVQTIQEFTGPSSVRLIDGTELQNIDVVLFCTGYVADLGAMMPPSADPYNPAHAPKLYADFPAKYVENRRIYRMYRGILSLQYPNSLAFFGALITVRPPFVIYDVISLALVNLWTGKYPMPSQQEMERYADARLRNMASTIKNEGDINYPGAIPEMELDLWFQKVARTGVVETIGNWWSWRAWSLWWQDPKLYKALLDGPAIGFGQRIFETGYRKTWDGAREALLRANEQVKELEREYKEKNGGKV